MRTERSIHETSESEREPGRPAAQRVGGADGIEPLRLPTRHLHLMRVFHGTAHAVAGAPAGRSLSPDARRVIRERLLNGTYATPQAIDELARRLLATAQL